MKTCQTKFARCLLVTTMLTAASPALAQETSSQAAQEARGPASDAAGVGAVGIGDIVVTARKRAEASQAVPISLTVASAQDLTNRSVQNLPDIQQTTPSLKMVQSSSSPISSYVAIRGQTVSTVQMSTDLAVGVYIDGVYQPRAYGLQTIGTMDIARVEVLKGPQGTLFGKNTTGGAINIATNTPSDVTEATIRMRADSRTQFSVGAMVNVPLGEGLAARIVGENTYRDHLGRDFTTGGKIGHTSQQMIRGTLSIKPSDSFSLLLRGDYFKFEGTGPAYKGLGVVLTTGSAFTRARTELGLPNTADGNAATLAALNLNNNTDLNSYQNFEPYERAEIYGASATAEWNVSDAITVKSITAQRWVKDNRHYDYDGTQFSIFNYPDAGTNERQFSEELQLLGTALGERLNYILGGYYSRESGRDLLVQISLGGAPSYQDADVVNKTMGGFFQTTYRFTDQLSFTGGIRYSKDWRDLTSHNRNGTTCTALGVSLLSIGGAANCVLVLPEAKFDGWSYTAGIEYKPVRGVLLYGKTSLGYRTGGIPFSGGNGTSAAAALATFTPFQPEHVTDYEVGIKADWLDGHLRTNLAYYHSEYKDIQRSRSFQAFPGGPIIPRTENIAAAKIDGVEAEVRLVPVTGLELGGTLGYIDPRYKEYFLPNPTNTALQLDQSSQPFTMVPKWTYSLSGAYEVPTTFGSVRAQVDWSWSDSYTASIGTLRGLPKVMDDGVAKSLGLMNARLAIRLDNPKLEFAVFGRNIFDKRIFVYPSVIESFGMMFNGPTNAPSTFGAEFTARF